MRLNMKTVLIFVELTLIVLTVSQMSYAEEKPVVIPLKEIWAFEMPGTRDIRELEPDKFGPRIRKLNTAEQIARGEKSLTNQAISHLKHTKPGQAAIPAFAVAGTGVDALREAAAVLSGKKKPQATFSANSDVSIVFFSYLCGSYVYLDKVEQQSGLIVISYRFVPHETREVTNHLALIPLGKLPPGEVKVDIKRLPLEKKFLDVGFKELPSSAGSQIVAQSFRFTVKDISD